MRLSFIFELLLIILIIAFSAYARVLDRNVAHQKRIKNTGKQDLSPIELPSLKQAEETMNKHCYCNENICNCCRDFHIPLVRLTGPGCASLQYLQGDNLQVQLSFGNNVLTTQTISGRNPKPICVALPGGYSKFCGKIYSIKKEADRHFKACLGLELQSSNELEASLRVSCFRFGPEGLKLRPAEEIPVEVTSAAPEEDDDDDIFGLDDDDDDEEEEDEEDDGVLPGGNQASTAVEDDDEDEEDDDEDDDVLGFGALLDIFTGDDETTKKPKVTTPSPILQPITIIPFLTTPASLLQSMNQQILGSESVSASETVAHSVAPSVQPEQPVTEKVAGPETVTEIATEETATETVESVTATESILIVENEKKKPESAEQVEIETIKPEKTTTPKPKKTIKPSHSSTTHHHIKGGNKKPVKPSVQTPDPAINDVVPQDEQEEEDDEDDILDTEDLDEEDDDDDDEKDESENEEEDEDEEEEDSTEESEESENVKDEDLEEELVDDDDDEEVEETEALGALIDDEETKEPKKTKKTKLSVPNKVNDAENQEEDDADYGYSLSELLARKTPKVYRGRESKVMRL